MRTSETLSKFAAAMLQAQAAITFAAKDAANPFFKSKYADLPTVIDAVKPALNAAGITFMQSATPSEPGTLSLTTRLMHSSGEWIEDTATAPLAKNDPQGYGSAITYLRRYSLAAMTGLYQDDDDGNAASQPEKIKAGVITPTTGAWDALGEDEQLFLTNIAVKVKHHIQNQDISAAVQCIDAEKLDADEKVALWTRFDSKERSAMKKESERLKQSNNLGVAA